MRALSILAVIAVAPACGGSDGTGGYTITDDMLSFETGEYEVAGGDAFECFYTDVVTDRELAVRGAAGEQEQGGHHITIYYTELVKDPQHHPCQTAEMADWRMIGGGGDEAEAAVSKLRMPDGLAIRVPAGAQIVLQSHYINLGESFTANDSASLELVPPGSIESYVNQFVFNDVGFSIPPHEELESVSTCTTPADVDLIRLLGHMHEWGSYYKLERLDGDDEAIETVIEKEWDPVYTSDPDILTFEPDQPMHMAAGTRLRQTCRWFNDTADPILFPREMCLAYGLYYPDSGEIFCDPD
jgi:hypothetical protein